jgi:predicted DNA-binding transcriptional regulator AlpA
MFEEQFIDMLANAVAEKVIARMAAQTAPSTPRRYLRVNEAAAYTGYSPDALRFHIRQQHFPVSRNGSGPNASIRIDRQDLDKWMLRNKA